MSLTNSCFFLLDVGDFASKVNETLTIDLGQSLRVQCPQHAPNYGASYSWESKNGTPFKRDHHRVISPDGELFIMYVTQKDVDEIASLEGIGCTITGGDTIYRSGLLTLKKRGKKKLFYYSFGNVVNKVPP